MDPRLLSVFAFLRDTAIIVFVVLWAIDTY